jgi:hypothetical protein
MKVALLIAILIVQASDEPRRFTYLLPNGFTGWVCVDFGVAGARSLPREGNALIIRPAKEEILKTSDNAGIVPPFGDAWIEHQGRRRALPQNVERRITRSLTRSETPVQRHCTFFGTVDAADAAGDAPGFEGDPREARGVSSEEREALVALYDATDGRRWKHKVGWLGPPGTECAWHGVGCEIKFDEPTTVTSLDLLENNVVGRIPEAVARLEQLEWLTIFGNRLTGRLPDALISRWLTGRLGLAVENSVLTDITEIDRESYAPALLCERHRIILRSDGSATLFTKRCRNATPDDRRTFCEVKKGTVWLGSFGKLALLLEKNGFFDLRDEYSRNVTHGGFDTIVVIRNGARHRVSNYADAGPHQLWIVQTAIDGVASAADWKTVTKQSECPAQPDR